MLRELAHMAFLDRTTTLEAELEQRALAAVRNALKIDLATVPVRIISVRVYDKPQLVEVEIDGLLFKWDVKTNTYDEVESEQVFVQRGHAFFPVNDLADVGKVFKSEPMPTIAPDDPAGDLPRPVERDPLLGDNSA